MTYAPGPYTAEPYAAAPYAAAPAATDPGRTLGIAGLVLSVFTALTGLVVSIVALRRSRKAGLKNGFALGHVAGVCKDLGPGTHQVNGVTYTCG